MLEGIEHNFKQLQNSRFVTNSFKRTHFTQTFSASPIVSLTCSGAAVAQWSIYRIMAGMSCVSSSPLPIKTHRVGQLCTLNLSRAETSSHWCGVVARRSGASSGDILVT
ncbi:hypothetical protein TNCV_1520091 [Trichonephila clavipes]|nr:hypothetical protein TNCV_1520091 [Trichonephila clavipes]